MRTIDILKEYFFGSKLNIFAMVILNIKNVGIKESSRSMG